MKAKVITFKPNKNGEVTLYLGAGADLRELIDLIGEEVSITKQGETEEAAQDLDIENILTSVERYGRRRYQEGMLNETAATEEPATEGVDPQYDIPIDPFDFGGGI